ncbi:hypothetical protein PGT21_036809 [Puccinia graminis f. sp. tritici]|uniref:Uncharacterized protein n=1 Tax=Puccinia graminis f. sp. tritici TaxID=56615 RepID=A0A5B0P3I7_PUCGR|nr:hypothetical protein PGT21_036809 [Puccinia graminis f. sp. tritici]
MLPSCPSKRAPPDTRRGSQLDLPQDNTRAGHSPQTIRLQRRPLSIWTVEEQQKPSADNTFASVEALFRSDIAGHPIDKAFSSAHLTQSDHSRRGSMSSQRHHSSNAPHAPLHHLHGLPTTQTSMPKLTLGNRSRYNEGVHPYDLILPGEETHRIPVRTRVLSAATAPATSVASDNQSKSFRVGARRFTQSGHASVHFDPLTRTINRSSVHGRRYSNAVREPSAAAASISSSNAGNPIHQSYHRLLVLFTSKKQWCL